MSARGRGRHRGPRPLSTRSRPALRVNPPSGVVATGSGAPLGLLRASLLGPSFSAASGVTMAKAAACFPDDREVSEEGVMEGGVQRGTNVMPSSSNWRR